ncbi:hypothetical protein [Corynebacterium glyciniphilum]|uniref:Uncharacterized protein n=1 Tax=Corynebacterium glyciniphilum AJ 3170 TaxID=1404245 RepID=X5DUH2_9CORY|nr:hypothetical protein [Corynebacterium glyciniphilum]AHW64287.1 Hypothetical protein CGLY_09210 [Corynebacterium glyciniphilum AJ 3170]
MNPGDLAAKTAAHGATEGAGANGEAVFDADSLIAQVDALLSSDTEGNDEAELLERAHRLINDAMEGR